MSARLVRRLVRRLAPQAAWMRWQQWAALAVLGYTAVLGTAFALVVPPFEAPDEPAHLAYVDFVATRAALPNQYGPDRPLTGHGISPTEGHQPPLYYAAAALLLRLTSRVPCMPLAPAPNPEHAWNGEGGTRTDVLMFVAADPRTDGSVRGSARYPCLLLLREVSVGLGVLNVAAVLALSRHFFRGPWQLMPAALVATLPQYLFASGVVSNDGLADLLISLCLLCAFCLLDNPTRPRAYVQLGLLLGLALLAKKTALFLLPGLAVLAGYLATVSYRHRSRGQLASVVSLSAATIGVAGAVAGWWFVRNGVLYGDLLGTQMEKTTLVALVQEKSLGGPYFRGQFPRVFLQSLVGTFGWMQIRMPAPVYWLYGMVGGVSLAGIPFWLRSRWCPRMKAGLAVLFVLSCFAGIVVYNLTYSQPQGRFLFPVIGLLAVFLAAGLRALVAHGPIRWRARIGAAVGGILIGALTVVDVVSLVSLSRFYS